MKRRIRVEDGVIWEMRCLSVGESDNIASANGFVYAERFVHFLQDLGEINLDEKSNKILMEPLYKILASSNPPVLYTLEEFADHVLEGMFMPYDGSGYYATEKEMSRIDVSFDPEQLKKHSGIFTHVVWFNK